MPNPKNSDASNVTLEKHSWNTLTPSLALEVSAQARRFPGLAHSEADGGFFIAARYDDVVKIHNNPALFSSTPSVFRPYQGAPPFPPLEMDGAEHKVWREVFSELVNPRTIKLLAPRILDDVNRHIDRFIGKGEADLLQELAEHVPVQTICRVGGIDDMQVAEEIRVRARAALEAGGRDAQAFVRYIGEFGDYVLPLVAERRTCPREDFLTHIAQVQIGGALLDDVAIRGVLFGLFAAGHHSTTTSMASLFVNVMSRRDVFEALKADFKLIPVAIEESLRMDPPFYGFYRRVTQDTELSGTKLAKDDSVLLNWMSANHDPQQFERPEEFRLDRTRNRHVAFGWGIHLCAGAPLARLELQIALEQLLRRLPDIELVGTPDRYFGGAGATYLNEVRVKFTPST